MTALGEELGRLTSYGEHHGRLVARLALIVIATAAIDRALELWAVIVVAGSAGAIATFFQSSDSD